MAIEIDKVGHEHGALGEHGFPVVRGKEFVFDSLVAVFLPFVVIGPEKESANRQIVRCVGQSGAGLSEDGVGCQEKPYDNRQQGADHSMYRVSLQHRGAEVRHVVPPDLFCAMNCGDRGSHVAFIMSFISF